MAKKRNDWIVIGISGVTCGGKTSLALKLLDALYPAHLYHQDEYFYPDDSPKHVKCENLDHNNYEILSSLDMKRMTEDVLDTMNGKKPGHESQMESRRGRFKMNGKEFLILEGFTTLNYQQLYELCDLKYYLCLSYEDCLSRRVLRLYDPPDTEGYFEQCVWPEHVKYKAKLETDKSVIMLDGTDPNVFEIVMKDLKRLGVNEIAI